MFASGFLSGIAFSAGLVWLLINFMEKTRPGCNC
jgi:hypothetical protein